MSERSDNKPMYATVSMAEVLLSQNLIQEATHVISCLEETEPSDPRVKLLSQRLHEMLSPRPVDSFDLLSVGVDRICLSLVKTGIQIEWELTEAGLVIAKRAVRYSGRSIVRIFTASAGQRGVRTQVRDIEIPSLLGRTLLAGMPRPAVHVGAVGYLANTGVFMSSAQSSSLKVDI
jgi:hypothetical protein